MAATNNQTEEAIIKLSYKEKVPVATMKEIIRNCLQERLTNFQYDGEKCNEAAKQLSDTIRIRLKSLGYDRYKYIVQVLIGERREQGMHFGTRCFWDSNTDNQASENFTNVSPRFHFFLLAVLQRTNITLVLSFIVICRYNRTTYFALPRLMRYICINGACCDMFRISVCALLVL